MDSIRLYCVLCSSSVSASSVSGGSSRSSASAQAIRKAEMLMSADRAFPAISAHSAGLQ